MLLMLLASRVTSRKFNSQAIQEMCWVLGKNVDKTGCLYRNNPSKIHSKHLIKYYYIFLDFSLVTSINIKNKMITILPFSCLLRSYLFKDYSRYTSMVQIGSRERMKAS